MSDEQIQREEQLVKLPKRPTNRCEPPAGCIIRGDKTLGTKTYCYAVPEWNVRKPEAYPHFPKKSRKTPICTHTGSSKTH
ncbi:hypothetical protein DIPPA_11133 [Diplonema papillatum]|nr:hypothetical protein DIPPA_11133 [Diplonema papillatum]